MVRYVQCPLRDCSWQMVDRSHLHHVVVLEGPDADDYLTGARPRLKGRAVDPREQMHGELLAHIRDEHVTELQFMLAGAAGGHGTPVVAQVTQHIDARQVQDAGDLVLSVLVPKMRAQMAADLAKRTLRPLDPWPAVTVLRLRWHEDYLGSEPGSAAPAGMRPAREDEQPDLWQLHLQTDAVPDTRTVEL